MPGPLDLLFGGLKDALHGVSGAFGGCNVCGVPALPLACCICGEKTCLEHAWISGEALTRQNIPRVVCSLCVDDVEVEDEDGPREHNKWQRDAKPADVQKERRAWARNVLGVTSKSTAQEIKDAYRSMAKKYHPDHNPGDTVAEAAFKQVDEAYRVLTKKDPP